MIRVSIADTGKIYVTINDDGPIFIRMDGVEPIRINAFNYPPEIDRLNQEVIEAKENASNATELATQASQAATTATESANAAGSLASQAAQAAQEAAGIAEGAATTAGEAAQAINEHAEAINNPHASNTTQTFAEANITGLKSDAGAGGEVPATLYNWFKSVYSSLVDSSVKSWIIGIVTYIKDLSPQLGLIFSGSIDLTKVDTHYNNYTQIGVLEITIEDNSIVGGSAEITITANGSAITVTGATQYGDTTIDYTNGKINHFLFTKFSNGIYYSVKQLN